MSYVSHTHGYKLQATRVKSKTHGNLLKVTSKQTHKRLWGQVKLELNASRCHMISMSTSTKWKHCLCSICISVKKKNRWPWEGVGFEILVNNCDYAANNLILWNLHIVNLPWYFIKLFKVKIIRTGCFLGCSERQSLNVLSRESVRYWTRWMRCVKESWKCWLQRICHTCPLL